MRILKTAFLISLFNFLMVGAVALAMKQTQPITASIPENLNIPTLVPTEMIISPTPTLAAAKKKTIAVKKTNPFSQISETVTETNNNNSNQNTNTVNNSQTTSNPTAAPQAQPTQDNRCIISVDGQRYDVTTFRSIHSGGNIFQCGADMSATFHAQHSDSYLTAMAKYRI